MPEPMTRDDVYREFATDVDDEGEFYGIQMDAMADEILRLRATLAQRRDGVTEAEQSLRDVILWALGEGDDFPERPDRVEGKPYPFYWWRSELRRRYDSALGARDGGAA